MDGIAVSTERIAAAGVGVTDVGGLLAGEIATMRDLLGQIQAGWQSDSAAPRFAAALQGHLDDAVVLKNALLGSGAALVGTGHRYAEAEEQLAAGLLGTHR